MEIKVTCGCGIKYKFDVEPVNRRMPWPVNCPSCGTDGTAQANEIIQQHAAATLPAALVATSIPVAAQLPPAPGGLRISTSPAAPAPPAPAMPAGVPVPPPPSAPGTIRPSQAYARQTQSAQKNSSSKLARVGSVVLLLLVVGLIGFRWFRRVNRIVNVVSAIMKVTSDASDADDLKLNLTADNEVIIYLRHTNHLEVADACCAYFHKQLNRNLRRKTPDQENSPGDEFMVTAPYNGYVEVVGNMDSLNEAEFTGLTEHLSGKFDTLAFVEQDVDKSGASAFGVYDKGTNQFYARMNVSMKDDEPVEVATVHGEDWAVAHGYKPGKDGFKDFNIENANDLTKNCGMKLWDRDDDQTSNDVTLKEWGGRSQ